MLTFCFCNFTAGSHFSVFTVICLSFTFVLTVICLSFTCLSSLSFVCPHCHLSVIHLSVLTVICPSLFCPHCHLSVLYMSIFWGVFGSSLLMTAFHLILMRALSVDFYTDTHEGLVCRSLYGYS